jgi:UrcA family protein
MSSHKGSSRRILRRVVAAIFVIVAGVPASFAQMPATDRPIPSITVGYADLNLATPEGSRVLYQRLRTVKQIRSPQLAQIAGKQRR